MSERWDKISSFISLKIFAGMLNGPTGLFGFKLEIILQIPLLLVGDKEKDLGDLFSMYSEKCLFE